MKVSVSLISYNQENYIAQAIESVLAQKTNFQFELVISDDASTDGTATIIEDYALKYPDIVKPRNRLVNLGLVQNALQTIEDCSGEYIALLEGDDYWVSADKLQRQADFLDENADCSYCYTNGLLFVEGTEKSWMSIQKELPTKFSLKYFLDNHLNLLNNTKMFRKSVHPVKFNDWFYETVQWDWSLHVLHAANHNIGYLDFIGMHYRRHKNAFIISSDTVKLLKSGLKTNKHLDSELDYKYHDFFKVKWWYFEELMLAHLEYQQYAAALRYLLKTLWAKPFRTFGEYRDIVWKIRTLKRKT
jgi:glycosyltransferase involved in cell wall biosynthesis